MSATANGWVEVDWIPDGFPSDDYESKWSFRVWSCSYRDKLQRETIGDRRRELIYESPFYENREAARSGLREYLGE